MKKVLIIVVTLVMLMPSASSIAAWEKPQRLDLARWYKVYWSGFHIADLKTRLTDNRLDAIIESHGIVKEVSKYSSKTSSEFKFTGTDYVPESFYTEFQQRRRQRKIDIKYTDQGDIVEEEVTPPDNRAKRPAVAETLKADAVDPLTAVVVAREKVRQALNNGPDEFSFKMYDGRRLSKLDFTVLGREVQYIRKRDVPVVTVLFKRFPVAGYTDNELRRIETEEPLVTLYLSDDELLLPLKADAKAPLGSAVIVLEKECPSLEACG